MAKSKMLQQNPNSSCHGVSVDAHIKKRQRKVSGKEWEDAICSICMEYPHNARVLLCSSYDKGCRSYICATGQRHSNCYEQFKKANTDVILNRNTQLDGKREFCELFCPLCRGQVRGWTWLKAARKYLNAKKRSCVQANCSFVGSYKELRKHVQKRHPVGRPRDVDQSDAEKWKNLQNERDLSDVLSTIRSTMPGGVVVGDYVIERSYGGISTDSNSDNVASRVPNHDISPRRWLVMEAARRGER